MSEPEPMTDWKKFALLVFALVLLAIVVWVFLTIRGDLARMV